MTDADRHAAGIIARHLRALNMAGADPDVVAMELVQKLRGHGWRPTPAQPAPPWQPGNGPRLNESQVHAIAAQARAAITKDNPLNHLDPDGGLD